MKDVMLYAGLAVMLMRKHRNVLPIKYLYRKSGVNDGGFTFEPVGAAGQDEAYLRSSIYPEIIYNSDAAGKSRKHRIPIGQIPDKWKRQFKGDKIYKRGRNTVPAGGGIEYEDYGYFDPDGKAVKKYTHGKPIVRTAKKAEDLLGGPNIMSNDKLYRQFKDFRQRPTSMLQISPRGMKARWVRGGGVGNRFGGGHLERLKTPQGGSLSRKMGTGDVDNLERSHIMNHWYKLYQHNYELKLRGQSRRVLVDFLNIMGKGERGKIKDKDDPAIQRKGTKVTKTRSKSGLKRTRRTGTKTLIKRMAKKVGIAGGMSAEGVFEAMKGVHGFKMLDAKGGPWKALGDETKQMDVNKFLSEIRKLQMTINADTYQRNRVPKNNRVIGVPLESGKLGLVVAGRPGDVADPPVQLTATVLMSGPAQLAMLIENETTKNTRNASKKVQTDLTTRQQKTNAVQEGLVDAIGASYQIIARSTGLSLAVEGTKGAEIPISQEFNEQLKRKMTKGVSANIKDINDNLRRQFDPMSEGNAGDFRDWFEKWQKESKRLENMTVESARRSGGWNDWMMRYVAPNPTTNNPRKGKLKNYRDAARTWHSPSYIRPFVMTHSPLDGSSPQTRL
tara:strand:- start:13691 stop:15532 length:1842 start_codon:yes stop_codon:yes gene_type:complete